MKGEGSHLRLSKLPKVQFIQLVTLTSVNFQSSHLLGLSFLRRVRECFLSLAHGNPPAVWFWEPCNFTEDRTGVGRSYTHHMTVRQLLRQPLKPSIPPRPAHPRALSHAFPQSKPVFLSRCLSHGYRPFSPIAPLCRPGTNNTNL